MMWGSGWGWMGAVLLIACVGFMIWMMAGHGMGHGGREHDERSRHKLNGGEHVAEEILGERFARGEISAEEFEQGKRVLHRVSTSTLQE